MKMVVVEKKISSSIETKIDFFGDFSFVMVFKILVQRFSFLFLLLLFLFLLLLLLLVLITLKKRKL
jgi:hypothetical protein